MIADVLLAKLEGVKRTGVDRWIAKCPAHEDKRPSLGVREIDGDRVLVHCWAGCGTAEVLGAVGLAFDDLFPPRPSNHAKRERHPFPAADVLRAVGREALVVAVAASSIANGMPLPEVDRQRLVLASSRLTAAVRESGYE